MNRDGMIPTVRMDGMVFVESSVIMRCLDRRHVEPPLVPRDPLEEAMRMDLLMKDLDEKFHHALGFIYFSERARNADGELTDAAKDRLKKFDEIPEPERRERRRNSIIKGVLSDDGRRACGFAETMIKDIDAALRHGPFLAGQSYSLADAALTPYIHRLWALGCEELWTATRPRVGDWYEKMRARPSFNIVFASGQRPAMARQDAASSVKTGTWSRFKAALESIGTFPDDPAARLDSRIWSSEDLVQ